MAGYSGTSLAKKLGINSGTKLHLIDAPPTLQRLLAPLPDGVEFVPTTSDTTDIIHVFSTKKARLAKTLVVIRKRMRPNAVVWVSWPKKAARVPTDLTEDVIRELALPLGLVDIKVCAVDDVWSGLKLMVRRELR
ncbi:MAG: hypothetical protein WBC51_03535 [Vicinamibacterales bacterium]